MAAPNDITVTNNGNSNTVYLRGVSVVHKKLQPSIDIPLINLTSAQNIIFRFTGQKRELMITFALFNDGVDVSNGTPGSIITLAAQIQYIMDTIYTHEWDTDWTLTGFGGRHTATSFTGTIESIDIPDNAGAGQVVVGTMTFKEGNIGSL